MIFKLLSGCPKQPRDMAPLHEEEETEETSENNDDSWMNASSNSFPALALAGSTSNSESFADYGDLDQYRFSSSYNDYGSSFANDNDKIPWPIWVESSFSSVDMHMSLRHDSASSFDLAHLFKDDHEEIILDDSKRVRFGTVTIREFSLASEGESSTFCSSSRPGEAFRLTLDWDHAPDVVTTIPDIQGGSHPRRLTYSQRCNRLLKVRGWTLSKRNLLTIDEEDNCESPRQPLGEYDDYQADHASVA